jgi:signal transduction histidine kinase
LLGGGGTVLALLTAELMHRGSGASALLAAVTLVVTFVAVLRRSEHERVEAVRREGATEERLRIARDLHDLLGHGLGVVAVQSSTARIALEGGDVPTAARAHASVERSSRSAMREVRQLLGVLRSDTDTRETPGLAQVPTLVENVRSAGTPVQAELEPVTTDPDVELCAYRVVQEGLTNAMKHAPGAPVLVRLAREPDRLVALVHSGGRDAGRAGGSGLAGLRTRVEAVGGTFVAGPVADGWQVEAVIPLPEAGE